MQDDKPILVSAVEYKNIVGKQYIVDDDGQLAKAGLGLRTDHATAIVKHFNTPKDYFQWAETLSNTHMQLSGNFPIEADQQVVRLTQKADKEELTAGSDWVSHRSDPAIIRIDADFKSADEVAALYPQQMPSISNTNALRDLLIKAAPMLAEAAMRVKPSSSSFLCIDGKQVSGPRGFHAEFAVDNGADIPAILSALHQKLIHMGWLWAFVSKSGSILVRSPVDLALDRPTQPIFGKAALLDERITYAGVTDTHEGCIVNTASLLAELSLEQAAVKEVDASINRAKAALAEKAEEVKTAFVRERAPQYAKTMGVSLEEAKKQLKQVFRGVLPLGFPIITTEGVELTAGDLYDKKWKGAHIKPPLEPDYRATTYVNHDEWGNVTINSFAHGGETYGVAPPEFKAPLEVAEGIKEIKERVKQVICADNPEVVLNEPMLAQELARVFRSATDTAKVYRMQTIGNAGFRLNAYSKTDYFVNVLDAYQLIRPSNIPKDIIRGANFSRWLAEHRVARSERTKINDVLNTVEAGVIKAVRDGIYAFIINHRQLDMLNYRVDMFAESGSIEIERRGAQVTGTLVQPHRPFDTEKYAHLSKEQYDACVQDYHAHFPHFDELLELVAAARFASDGREAFFWLKAVSSFGKNFLTDGVFGKGLDGAGLGITMQLSMDAITAAMEGKPSPINPDEHAGAWILFCDEFKAVSGSLKELNNTLRVSPKNRMQGELRLYLKWFASDEDAPSMSQGGVDRQLANRFSFWEVNSGKLTDRALYQESSNTYLNSVRKYVAEKLNELVIKYQELGFHASQDAANKAMQAFHSKYNIAKVFGLLDDELALVAQEFTQYIADAVRSDIVDLHASRELQNLYEDTLFGSTSTQDPVYWLCLKNPEKHLETFIKKKKGQSEVVKYMNRKSELMELAGERTKRNNNRRIYHCERGTRAFIYDGKQKKMSQFRGLLIDAGNDASSRLDW